VWEQLLIAFRLDHVCMTLELDAQAESREAEFITLFVSQRDGVQPGSEHP
jgi:hypothetical protein